MFAPTKGGQFWTLENKIKKAKTMVIKKNQLVAKCEPFGMTRKGNKSDASGAG